MPSGVICIKIILKLKIMPMKQKLTMVLTFLFLGIGLLSAQSQRVTGTVTSAENGEPIIGATVLVEGTQIGVITDVSGKFTLPNVPASAKNIRISYIGMETISVPVQPVINIQLKTDKATLIDDVVVMGMTQQDRRIFAGATDKLIAEDVKIDGLSEISRALEGRAAGVSVTNVSGTFGAAPKMRVRGATSILGNSQPLWVVDGIVMEDIREISSEDLSSGNAETLISSAISGLNADDIESIQILKDGSATSIYGARAMAGVIVVTTKSGKSGVTSVNYTGEFTMRLVPSYTNFNIMNSQDQMGIYQEMQQKGWLNHAELSTERESGVYGKMYHLLETYDPVTGMFMLENTVSGRNKYLRQAEMRNTDWFSNLFDNKVMQLHSVSMSTGNEKANFYGSLSALVDPGWSKRSDVDRYTANFNGNVKLSKTLELKIGTTASYRKQFAPGTLGQETDVVRGEVKRDFDINPYSYALNTSRALDPNEYYTRNYAPFNILHELQNNFMEVNNVDAKFYAQLKFKPVRTVTFTALGSVRYNTSTIEHHIKDRSNQAEAYRAMPTTTIRDKNPFLYTDPEILYAVPISVMPEGGIYNKHDYRALQYDLRLDVKYNESFNNNTHIVDLYGGMEVNSGDRRATFFRGWGMQYSMGEVPFYAYQVFKQGVENNNQYYSMANTFTRFASFFANATYSYKHRYSFTGTVRYDGSNRLGMARKARWLPTWNAAFRWNVSEENFFKALNPVVTNFTLRTSYSLVGNSGPTSVSNSRVVIRSTSPWRPFSSVQENALYVSAPANGDLTFEKQHEYNVGFDAGFINDRINVTLDWYARRQFDLIGYVNTQGFSGQISKQGNVAKMKSGGIEVSLNSTNIKTKDFTWSTDFVYSHTHNEVTKLETTMRVIDMVAGGAFSMEGHPTRSIFSFDFKGLNEVGIPQHVNEKHQITTTDINFQEREVKDHLKYSGTVDPTDVGSFGNVFRYKNWRLNIFMTYSWGNVVRLNPIFSSSYTDMTAMPKEFNNRWVLAGDERYTNIPVIASRGQSFENNQLSYAYNAYNYSTARIAKGDFIRMKEISLSYDFPKVLVSKWGLSALSLKVQATNPFLIYADKKLNGQDPEFFNSGGVAAPVPKQFTLTLRIGL